MASSMQDASFLDDLSENFLQCPIHLDRFDKPKMLPCLHSVCLSCLAQWHKQMGGEDQVTCPQCRKVCPVPSDGVQDFPDNFFMNSLLEYVKQVGGDESEGADIKRCDICEKDSPNAEAMRCVDCAMFLCGACTASHKKIPQTAGHQLISVVEFNDLSVAAKLSLVSPLCPKHPTSRLEFFCAKCKITVCTQCTVVAHRAPVHSIQELAEAFAKIAKQLKGEIKGSGKRYSKVQLAIADTSETLTELETQRDAAYEAAQQQADSIIELVSQYLAEIEEQIDQEYADKKEVLDERLEDLLGIEEDFKHTREFGERLMEYGNQVTLASVGPEIISKLRGLSSAFQKKEGVEVKADLQFQINQQFEDEFCSDSIGFVKCEEDVDEEKEEEEQEDEEEGYEEEDPSPSSPIDATPSIRSLMAIASPENTFIERTFKGKTLPGKMLQLPIRVRDSQGNLVKDEDDTAWNCKMQKPSLTKESFEELKRSGLSAGTASICKHEDGSKFISFLPQVTGRFILYVTMNGKPIKTYPYTVQVYPPRQDESITALEAVVSQLANLQMQFGGFGTEPKRDGQRRRRRAHDDSSDTESISSEKGGRGGSRGGRGGGRGGRRGGGRGGGRGGRGRGGSQEGRRAGGSNEKGSSGGVEKIRDERGDKGGGRGGSSERGSARGGRGKKHGGKGGEEGGGSQGGERSSRGGGRGGRGGGKGSCQGGESNESGGQGGDKSSRGGKGGERVSSGNDRGGRGGGKHSGGNRGRGGKSGK